jgi:hypothetical protein
VPVEEFVLVDRRGVPHTSGDHRDCGDESECNADQTPGSMQNGLHGK